MENLRTYIFLFVELRMRECLSENGSLLKDTPRLSGSQLSSLSQLYEDSIPRFNKDQSMHQKSIWKNIQKNLQDFKNFSLKVDKISRQLH